MTEQFSPLHMLRDSRSTEVVLEDKLQVPGDNASSGHLELFNIQAPKLVQWGFRFLNTSLQSVFQIRTICSDLATTISTMQTTSLTKSRLYTSLHLGKLHDWTGTTEFYAVNLFGTCLWWFSNIVVKIPTHVWKPLFMNSFHKMKT